METTTTTPAQQFADDYLLIAMNDQKTYNRLMSWADGREAYALAELIKTDYEEEMANIIGEKDTPRHWMARQHLLCWGIEPFILIARDVLVSKAEIVGA